MKSRASYLIATLVVILCARSKAQIYQELYSFSDQPDGAVPEAGLVEGSDGYLYGMTYYGGLWGKGTAFKVSKEGSLTIIASLGSNTVSYPSTTFVLATDGNFYSSGFILKSTGVVCNWSARTEGDWGLGTNDFFCGFYSGDGTSTDCGSVYGFPLRGTNGQFSHQFTWDRYSRDGVFPGGSPIQARDGYFYGTTSGGGTNGWGTVYRMTSDGQLTTVASFAGTNGGGAYPYGPLLQASDGNFYGTSEWGDWGLGVIFKVTPAGVITTFHSFDSSDGENPNPGLIEGKDGNIYGTASQGGFPQGLGTVFRITPHGTGTAVVTFTGVYGAYPGASPYAGMVQGRDGNLYGTCGTEGTHGGGNVFRIIMPGPQLNLNKLADQAVLSWRTNYTSYTLQVSVGLTPPNWTDCTNSPAVAGQQYLVTNPVSPGSRFFRLRK